MAEGDDVVVHRHRRTAVRGIPGVVRLRAHSRVSLAAAVWRVQPQVHRRDDVRAHHQQRDDGKRRPVREGRQAQRRTEVRPVDSRRRLRISRHAGVRVVASHSRRRVSHEKPMGRRVIRFVLLPVDRLSWHARADRRDRADDDSRPAWKRSNEARRRRDDGPLLALRGFGLGVHLHPFLSGVIMRGYWATWSVLLVFTVVMPWADSASLPRMAFVVFMLAAMLTKASIIGANFMHLKSERVPLITTVVVGLLVTGAILYVLIVPDAARIHEMAARYGPR